MVASVEFLSSLLTCIVIRFDRSPILSLLTGQESDNFLFWDIVRPCCMFWRRATHFFKPTNDVLGWCVLRLARLNSFKAGIGVIFEYPDLVIGDIVLAGTSFDIFVLDDGRMLLPALSGCWGGFPSSLHGFISIAAVASWSWGSLPIRWYTCSRVASVLNRGLIMLPQRLYIGANIAALIGRTCGKLPDTLNVCRSIAALVEGG